MIIPDPEHQTVVDEHATRLAAYKAAASNPMFVVTAPPPPPPPPAPPLEVLASNEEAFYLFLRNANQIRWTDSRPIGMDYTKPFAQLAAAGIVGKRWEDQVLRLEVIEVAFIEAINDRIQEARGKT